MLESPWLIAALWIGMALLASMISIRVGISVALIEIIVGAVAGNVLPWAGSGFGAQGAMAVAHYVLGWKPQASMIAGTALSTTSVAVVYAVMIETGLNRKDIGKLI